MSTELDHYTILTSDGRVARTGYGPVPMMKNMDQLTVLHNATKDEIEERQEVITARALVQAHKDRGAVKTENRSDAFALKKLAARQFLSDVPELTPTPGVLDCLALMTDERYEELHDEYEATHHLINGMSPWDLARAIVARSKASVKSEIQRRVIILEAEATIESNGGTA